MSSRRAFLLGGLALAAGACAATTPARSGVSPEISVPGSTPVMNKRAVFVATGPVERAAVALTFHTNGDLRLAQRLLDITTTRQVPVTCFIVGDWLEQNPTWGPKLIAAGHELANHTFTHPDVTKLTQPELEFEISRCRDILTLRAHGPGRYFRPSGIDDGTAPPSDLVLRAAATSGYPTVLGFGVDPFDYRDPGTTAVASRMLAGSRPGSIISLHFGHPGTVDALPMILDGLAGQNLLPVTVSGLLGAG